MGFLLVSQVNTSCETKTDSTITLFLDSPKYYSKSNIILSASKDFREFRRRNLHFLGKKQPRNKFLFWLKPKKTSFLPDESEHVTNKQKQSTSINKKIQKKKLPFLGKSGTTRILVLIPLIRGSSSCLFPDIVNEEQKIKKSAVFLSLSLLFKDFGREKEKSEALVRHLSVFISIKHFTQILCAYIECA